VRTIENIILYTTGCPRCKIIEKKLELKDIKFEVNTDEDEMVAIGMTEAPSLLVDGKLLGFTDAVAWINSI